MVLKNTAAWGQSLRPMDPKPLLALLRDRLPGRSVRRQLRCHASVTRTIFPQLSLRLPFCGSCRRCSRTGHDRRSVLNDRRRLAALQPLLDLPLTPSRHQSPSQDYNARPDAGAISIQTISVTIPLMDVDPWLPRRHLKIQTASRHRPNPGTRQPRRNGPVHFFSGRLHSPEDVGAKSFDVH